MFNYLKNYSKSSKKITIKNVANFIKAKMRRRKASKKNCQTDIGKKEASLIDNQANWRLEQVKRSSPICLEQGYCKHCFCSWEDGKHYEDDACSLGCYPSWVNDDTWRKLNEVKDELSCKWGCKLEITWNCNAFVIGEAKPQCEKKVVNEEKIQQITPNQKSFESLHTSTLKKRK